MQLARRAVYEAIQAVRPDAVALVDSFGFEDFLLNSAIGRADGDVYRCAHAPATHCAYGNSERLQLLCCAAARHLLACTMGRSNAVLGIRTGRKGFQY